MLDGGFAANRPVTSKARAFIFLPKRKLIFKSFGDTLEIFSECTPSVVHGEVPQHGECRRLSCGMV